MTTTEATALLVTPLPPQAIVLIVSVSNTCNEPPVPGYMVAVPPPLHDGVEPSRDTYTAVALGVALNTSTVRGEVPAEGDTMGVDTPHVDGAMEEQATTSTSSTEHVDAHAMPVSTAAS